MYRRNEQCNQPYQDQPAYVRDLQSDFPMIRFIDPNAVLCSPQGCNPVLGGILVYRDALHLNDPGSRLIGQRLVDMGVSLIDLGSTASIN
jgi:hypothetical protein